MRHNDWPKNAAMLVVTRGADALSKAIQSLRKSGFTVSSLRDMHACLSALRTASPDLVLLDATADSADALDVCRQLRTSPPSARPRVVIVVPADAALLVAARAAGCDDCIVAPVRAGELVARVVACLNTPPQITIDDAAPTMLSHYESVMRSNLAMASRLRKLTEIAPGVIGDYLLTPDGRVTMPSASKQLEEITGWSAEAVRRDASCALATVHQDDLAQHIASIDRSARELTPWHNEFRIHHPKKGEIWLEGRSIPEREADGAIRWYGFLHDVTLRKRAEERVSASERQLRTLAENLPVSVMRYDCDNRCVFVTAKFEALTGIPRHAVVGKTLDQCEALPRCIADPLRASLKRALAHGGTSEFEIEGMRDGKPTWQSVRVIPECSPTARIASALVIGTDITAYKQMERGLRALANRREADRELERRRIAHELHDELGQQLVALRLNVNLLAMQFGANEPRFLEATSTILSLVDTVIQSARDVSASLRPAVLDMGLVPALEWLITRLQTHTGLRCTLRLRAGEVRTTDECALAIFRIVQESLTNVARHSKAERVEVELLRAPDAYQVVIRDYGQGFDIATTCGSASFGLVGIRERALAAGGEAFISSSPGRGTVVRARIPIDPAAHADDCDDAATGPGRPSEAPRTRRAAKRKHAARHGPAAEAD